MFDEFSKYALAESELVDMDGDSGVNFYRKNNANKNVTDANLLNALRLIGSSKKVCVCLE